MIIRSTLMNFLSLYIFQDSAISRFAKINLQSSVMIFSCLLIFRFRLTFSAFKPSFSSRTSYLSAALFFASSKSLWQTPSSSSIVRMRCLRAPISFSCTSLPNISCEFNNRKALSGHITCVVVYEYRQTRKLSHLDYCSWNEENAKIIWISSTQTSNNYACLSILKNEGIFHYLANGFPHSLGHFDFSYNIARQMWQLHQVHPLGNFLPPFPTNLSQYPVNCLNSPAHFNSDPCLAQVRQNGLLHPEYTKFVIISFFLLLVLLQLYPCFCNCNNPGLSCLWCLQNQLIPALPADLHTQARLPYFSSEYLNISLNLQRYLATNSSAPVFQQHSQQYRTSPGFSARLALLCASPSLSPRSTLPWYLQVRRS